jgi:hypothetical protein
MKMTKTSMIYCVIFVATGCAHVGFTPQEMCSNDGMVFAGRTYGETSSVAVTSVSGETLVTGESSSERGISCVRPANKEEKCEVEAAGASHAIKNKECMADEAWTSSCSDVAYTWDYDVRRIETNGLDEYNKVLGKCLDLPEHDPAHPSNFEKNSAPQPNPPSISFGRHVENPASRNRDFIESIH